MSAVVVYAFFMLADDLTTQHTPITVRLERLLRLPAVAE